MTLAGDALAGATGGILGTLAMEKASQLLYGVESTAARKREEAIREEPPYQAMAAKILGLLGQDLPDEQVQKAGQVLHWAYGIGWGALYGIARRRAPVFAAGFGLPFAGSFALIGDELINWMARTAPPPQAFPWQAHARGFAAHAVFVAVAEIVCRGSASPPISPANAIDRGRE